MEQLGHPSTENEVLQQGNYSGISLLSTTGSTGPYFGQPTARFREDPTRIPVWLSSCQRDFRHELRSSSVAGEMLGATSAFEHGVH